MSTKKQIFIFTIILILFVSIRFFGLDFSYFQDERKYAATAELGSGVISTPHPPVGEFIFGLTALVFGADNFRLMIFIFSIANFFLLFYLVKYKFGVRAALWSSLFFAVAFYSVLASLTVDVDGAFLPFFLLLTLIAYFKWKDSGREKEQTTQSTQTLQITQIRQQIYGKKIYWGVAIAVFVILGFLTKLSFIILPGAIIIDLLWDKRKSFTKPNIMKYGLLGVGFLTFLIILFLKADSFLPSGGILRAVDYAKNFTNISGRNYLQVLIQSAKALFYASPLLIVPLFFISKKRFDQVRIYLIFLALGLIFNLVLFDFSLAALDKYLALIIIPLAIIGGVVIADLFRYPNSQSKAPSEKTHPNNIKEFLHKNGILVFWGSYIVAVILFMCKFLS